MSRSSSAFEMIGAIIAARNAVHIGGASAMRRARRRAKGEILPMTTKSKTGRAAALAVALMSGPAWAAGWQNYERLDKLGGKTDARLQAKETTIFPHRRAPDREHIGKMEFRCIKGGTTSIAVGIDRQLVAGHSATVRYRLDDSKPASAENWTATTENEGIGITGKAAVAFTKRLLSAKTMFVSIEDNVFGTTEMSFDIEWRAEAIKPVRAACKW
jgi:hypothetical protein